MGACLQITEHPPDSPQCTPRVHCADKCPYLVGSVPIVPVLPIRKKKQCLRIEPQVLPMMRLLGLVGFVVTFFGFVDTAPSSLSDPIVQISTGRYVGRYIPEFKQDVFLGVPYADKPVRFSPATLATGSAGETKVVKEYGFSCSGYGSDTTKLVSAGTITLDEDCLNLNVIRPSGEGNGLPVLVWIYGGGWQQGQTADPRLVSGLELNCAVGDCAHGEIDII